MATNEQPDVLTMAEQRLWNKLHPKMCARFGGDRFISHPPHPNAQRYGISWDFNVSSMARDASLFDLACEHTGESLVRSVESCLQQQGVGPDRLQLGCSMMLSDDGNSLLGYLNVYVH